MITPDMLAYISRELEAGKTRDQVKLSLIQGGGWRGSDVDEAFAHLEHPHIAPKVPKHSSKGLTVVAILILIIGGAYFIAQRYNIHSYQDVLNLVTRIKTHFSGTQGM